MNFFYCICIFYFLGQCKEFKLDLRFSCGMKLWREQGGKGIGGKVEEVIEGQGRERRGKGDQGKLERDKDGRDVVVFLWEGLGLILVLFIVKIEREIFFSVQCGKVVEEGQSMNRVFSFF